MGNPANSRTMWLLLALSSGSAKPVGLRFYRKPAMVSIEQDMARLIEFGLIKEADIKPDMLHAILTPKGRGYLGEWRRRCVKGLEAEMERA